MHSHLIGTGIQVSHRHHPNLRGEFNKALLCPVLGLCLQIWFYWDTTTSKHLCLDIYGCLEHCIAGQSWVETSETESPRSSSVYPLTSSRNSSATVGLLEGQSYVRVAVDWHYWCASVAVVATEMRATPQAGNCSQVRRGRGRGVTQLPGTQSLKEAILTSRANPKMLSCVTLT